MKFYRKSSKRTVRTARKPYKKFGARKYASRTNTARKTYRPAYATRKPYYKKVVNDISMRRIPSVSTIPRPVRQKANKALIRDMAKLTGNQLMMFNDHASATSLNEDRCMIQEFYLGHALDLKAMRNKFVGSESNAGMFNFYLKSGSAESYITNNHDKVLNFNWWLVTAKRDLDYTNDVPIGRSPKATWKTGVENTNYGNQPPLTGTCWGYETPGSKPTDSPLFSQYWSVTKSGSHSLLPGRTKIMRWGIPNLPYMIVTAADDPVTMNNDGAKGIVTCLLVQYFGPILQAGAKSDIKGYQGSSTVATINHKRYNFSYLSTQGNKSSIYYSDANQANDPLTYPYYVNPISGVYGEITPVKGPTINGLFPVVGAGGNATDPVKVIGTGVTTLATAFGTKAAT